MHPTISFLCYDQVKSSFIAALQSSCDFHFLYFGWRPADLKIPCSKTLEVWHILSIISFLLVKTVITCCLWQHKTREERQCVSGGHVCFGLGSIGSENLSVPQAQCQLCLFCHYSRSYQMDLTDDLLNNERKPHWHCFAIQNGCLNEQDIIWLQPLNSYRTYSISTYRGKAIHLKVKEQKDSAYTIKWISTFD